MYTYTLLFLYSLSDKDIEIYNNLAQRVEDWAFKYIVPPILKGIQFGLKLTLFYAFYLLAQNIINEVF